MALRAKVLQKKAEKFERKKLGVLKVTVKGVSDLEPLLQDVYANRRPKPMDYEVRRDLVRVFNEIAKEIYGNSKDIPVVVEFGSFVMDLFSTTSDLDLSVNFNTDTVAFPRERKIQTLRKFARKLYAIQSKGHVSGVLPITTAKVPILKCFDRGTGVECDISVENRDGILKSHLIHIISYIDERFKKLSFLMKTWAKAHNINSSKDKTLNSLSIILLVAFHLQTRNPPILPPFSAILKDGTEPATVVKTLSNFVNYGKRNTESLAELFVSLLIKLSSVEKLWSKGLCASTCSGSWTSKTWNSKVACIGVEDFTDMSQNVARAVGQAEVQKIYKCIDNSIRHIFFFMDGQIGVQLKDLLFGQDGTTISFPRGISNLHPIAALPCSPSQVNRAVSGKRKKQAMRPDSALKNRIIPTEGRAGTQSGRWEQVQQSVLPESSLAKKMQTTEGWRGRTDGRWGAAHVEGWSGAQHVDSTTRMQQPTRGWDVVMHAGGGGWQGTWQAAAGGWQGTWQPRAGGARGVSTEQSSAGGWGVTQQTDAGGWEAAPWHSAGGSGGTQQHGGGGWGVTKQPSVGGWGRSSDHLRRTDADHRTKTW